MRLPHAGAFVVIEQYPGRQVRHIDGWFPWHDSQLILHVASNTLKLPRGVTQGLVTLDDPADVFFWRYRVLTNRPSDAKHLLTASVKWQIEQLRQFYPQRGVEVRIQPGRLVVRKHYLFRYASQLERFVQLSLDLYDQLLLAQSSGVEIVSSSQPAVPHPMVCQVCGDVIETDLVWCRRCRTPHHRDCWEFTGVCSVYACGETEFVEANGRPPSSSLP